MIGSSAVKNDHRTFLKENVLSVLKAGGSILLVGMASRSGSAKSNQALSQRRADAVLSYLRSLTTVPFKVKAVEADGEQAAKAAGVPDGNEHPNWRAVLIVYWDRPEPPPLVFDEPAAVTMPSTSRLVRYVYTERKEIEPRDPEAPNPFLMWLSDQIKDAILEKAGHKPAAPATRIEATTETKKHLRDDVLLSVSIVRTRTDMVPSLFIRPGSHVLNVQKTFVYGRGDANTKVLVTTRSTWIDANGKKMSSSSETRTLNQPGDLSDVRDFGDP